MKGMIRLWHLLALQALTLGMVAVPATPVSTSGQVPPPDSSDAPSAFGAAVPHGADVYLFGGWDERGMHSSVARIEECGAVLRILSRQSPWAARGYFPGLAYDGRFYIFGGFEFAPPSNVLGDVWSSADAVGWDLEAIDPHWERREAHAAVHHNGDFYLFGGLTYFRPEKSSRTNVSRLRLFSDVWRSRDGFAWERVTQSVPWGRRRSFGYGVNDGFIWLWGGVDDESGKLYNDVWRSRDGQKWERVLEQAPWSPRMVNNHVSAFRGRLWVIGGGASASTVVGLNDVWSSDDGRTWQRETESPGFSPRIGAFVAPITCGSRTMLALFGGMNEAGLPSRRLFYEDLWISPDGKDWKRMDYAVR